MNLTLTAPYQVIIASSIQLAVNVHAAGWYGLVAKTVSTYIRFWMARTYWAFPESIKTVLKIVNFENRSINLIDDSYQTY